MGPGIRPPAIAREASQTFRCKSHKILPVEHHAAGKFGFLWQQLQYCTRQHGLAAAGFADNTSAFGNGADLRST